MVFLCQKRQYVNGMGGSDFVEIRKKKRGGGRKLIYE